MCADCAVDNVVYMGTVYSSNKTPCVDMCSVQQQASGIGIQQQNKQGGKIGPKISNNSTEYFCLHHLPWCVCVCDEDEMLVKMKKQILRQYTKNQSITIDLLQDCAHVDHTSC